MDLQRQSQTKAQVWENSASVTQVADQGSIVENYAVLKQLWSECLTFQLDPDVKGRIIGVQAQMATFDVLFGMQLAMKILKITDN